MAGGGDRSERIGEDVVVEVIDVCMCAFSDEVRCRRRAS